MRLDPAASVGNLLTSAGLKWNERTANCEEYDDDYEEQVNRNNKEVFSRTKNLDFQFSRRESIVNSE